MAIDPRIPLQAVARPVSMDAFARGVQQRQSYEANKMALQQKRTQQMEQAAQKIAQGVMSSENKPEAYRMALSHAKSMGFKTENFPQEWGPEAETAMAMILASPQERSEFERLSSSLDPQERMRAIRVRMGLEPDANAQLRGRTGDEPKPLTNLAKLRADYEAGRLDKGTYDAAVAKATAMRNGIRMSLDENGRPVMEVGGPAGGGAPLGRAATNELQKKLTADEELASDMSRIAELTGFDPATGKISREARKFFTYRGAVEAGAARLGSKLEDVPLIGGRLAPSEEAEKFAEERQAIFVGIEQMFNAYRKEITGAAAAVQELDRLKKTFLNADMGPDQFERVFAETVQKMERIRQIRVELLQRGYDPGTKAGDEALSRIFEGDASVEDYPAKGGAPAGGASSPSAPASPADLSDEDLMRMLQEGG